MNGWEFGECDKESEKNIEALRKTLFEYVPVGDGVDHAVALLLLQGSVVHVIVVAEETLRKETKKVGTFEAEITQPFFFPTHVQGQCEVGVETREKNEEGRDEVVDGRRTRVGGHGDRDYIDDGHNRAAEILKEEGKTQGSEGRGFFWLNSVSFFVAHRS